MPSDNEDKNKLTTTSKYLTKTSTYDKLRQKQLPEYYQTLEKNPLYSLEVDPLNLYDMSDEQKDFILCYVEYKNLPVAASYSGIKNEDARKYMTKYGTRQEIRRLNSAMSQRQFATQMLNLQQLGGYLTSLIEGTDVYEVDQLDANQKLKASELLVKINETINDSMTSPSVIVNDALTKELENLNVEQLEGLLNDNNKNKDNEYEKTELIQKLNYDRHLMPEEVSYLKTLSTNELKDLLDNQQEIILKKPKGEKKE